MTARNPIYGRRGPSRERLQGGAARAHGHYGAVLDDVAPGNLAVELRTIIAAGHSSGALGRPSIEMNIYGVKQPCANNCVL